MADGKSVNLCASIRHADSARHAFVLGARSIGLVRSEFLSTEHDQIPDTEFYQHSFRQLCEAASGLSVTLRLLGVAADKIPLWLPFLDSIGQTLGQQGVRLYHSEPVRSIVDAQLSAVSMLSTEIKLRVLIPYITRLEEYIYWLPQIQGCLPVLLGLGYRTFSVDAPFIPYLILIVANTTQQKCEKLALQVCAAKTTQQVLQILQLPADMH